MQPFYACGHPFRHRKRKVEGLTPGLEGNRDQPRLRTGSFAGWKLIQHSQDILELDSDLITLIEIDDLHGYVEIGFHCAEAEHLIGLRIGAIFPISFRPDAHTAQPGCVESGLQLCGELR